MHRSYFIIIYGPTAVGKTEFAAQLAKQVRGEIINADVGQFYRSVSIGTAKPPWKSNTVKHHLFDILDKPIDLTVTKFGVYLQDLMNTLWNRGKIPIVVGGSGFYLNSILFPSRGGHKLKQSKRFGTISSSKLWEKLKKIDPARAQAIHPHDVYRVQRALEIWNTTGQLPSSHRPHYEPPAQYLFIFLTREREQLYKRIGERVYHMMEQGWLQEAEQLRGTEWETFLCKKGLIGYDDIFDYLRQPPEKRNYENLVASITQKTRRYAKRQGTFWRMMRNKLVPLCGADNSRILEVKIDGQTCDTISI